MREETRRSPQDRWRALPLHRDLPRLWMDYAIGQAARRGREALERSEEAEVAGGHPGGALAR